MAAEAAPALARLLRRRLTVRGISAADMDIRTGAGLPDSSRNPDVLVTQIPYRPAEDLDPFGILDFVDDAALRLTADVVRDLAEDGLSARGSGRPARTRGSRWSRSTARTWTGPVAERLRW